MTVVELGYWYQTEAFDIQSNTANSSLPLGHYFELRTFQALLQFSLCGTATTAAQHLLIEDT